MKKSYEPHEDTNQKLQDRSIQTGGIAKEMEDCHYNIEFRDAEKDSSSKVSGKKIF